MMNNNVSKYLRSHIALVPLYRLQHCLSGTMSSKDQILSIKQSVIDEKVIFNLGLWTNLPVNVGRLSSFMSTRVEILSVDQSIKDEKVVFNLRLQTNAPFDVRSYLHDVDSRLNLEHLHARRRLLVHLLLNTNMVYHVEGHRKVAIPIRKMSNDTTPWLFLASVPVIVPQGYLDTTPWLFLASVQVIVPQGYHMLPSITPNPGCFWRLFQLQFLRGVMLKLLERSRGYGLLDHHCITIGLWIMDYGLILTYLNTIIECDLPSGCRPHQQNFFLIL